MKWGLPIFVLCIKLSGGEEADIDARILSQRERLQTLEEMVTQLEQINSGLSEQLGTILEENRKNQFLEYKTCHQIKQSYPDSESGTYYLDPQGSHSPVEVFCDMKSGGETHIKHNNPPATISYCEGEGCFKTLFSYSYSGLTKYQLNALLDYSDDCQQEIIFRCKGAPLKSDGQKFAAWLDKNSEPQHYFSGNETESHVCGCYHAVDGNNCTGRHYHSSCNCDAMAMTDQWAEDRGTVGPKSLLPVRGFTYGGLHTSAAEIMAASVEVGPLVCSGTKRRAEVPNVAEVSECPEEKRHQCKNGKCIRPHWVCDGDNDCGDYSDERNC